MRPYIVAAIASLTLSLAACGPRAADSQVAAPPPASVPKPQPAAQFDGDFKLVGTEPFWAVAIEGGRLVLARPAEADVVVPRPAPVIDGQSAIWTSGALIVSLAPGECSDGMSDRRYAYTATVRVGGAALNGCGDRPEALGAQPG